MINWVDQIASLRMYDFLEQKGLSHKYMLFHVGYCGGQINTLCLVAWLKRNDLLEKFKAEDAEFVRKNKAEAGL